MINVTFSLAIPSSSFGRLPGTKGIVGSLIKENSLAITFCPSFSTRGDVPCTTVLPFNPIIIGESKTLATAVGSSRTGMVFVSIVAVSRAYSICRITEATTSELSPIGRQLLMESNTLKRYLPPKSHLKMI